MILLVALALTAVAGCLLGYRGLDRIDVSVLRGGQGLWAAGGVAAMSMDVFMLTDFLADRARSAGRPGAADAAGDRVRRRAGAVGVGAGEAPSLPRAPGRGGGDRVVGLPAGG